MKYYGDRHGSYKERLVKVLVMALSALREHAEMQDFNGDAAVKTWYLKLLDRLIALLDDMLQRRKLTYYMAIFN